MRLFLDTSVLLAAIGSATGASREIFNRASGNQWILIATPYVLEETSRNLHELPTSDPALWTELSQRLTMMPDVLTVDRPAVFEAAKDRPILFSALAWADVLLTLDRADFGSMIGGSFYDLRILRPGMFLEQQRLAGMLI